MLSRRSVIETSAKSPIAAAISSAATALEPFVDLLAFQIDQAQRMHAGRPFGVGCVSDRPFDVRDANGRLGEHGCALLCRRAEELKAVCRRPETHSQLLHAAGMRARPVEVLNKNDTLPSRQTASIRLGIAGRRVNPMTIPGADRDRRNILSNRRNFCQ